jgi:leader peptidase (prepilin peptidase)/N-methyltransferase
MGRRNRRNWTLVLTLLVLAAAAAGYVAGVPLVQQAATSPDRFSVPVGDQIRFRTFELLLFAWLFMFGASIGSFLNVVIYRVPRGVSLLGSSRCPHCCVAIRPRDNIPVFAWFLLRGRCRVCRLPISPRYPLVEFAVGLLILILGSLEVLRAGANLPAQFGHVGQVANITWLIHRPDWDLVVACILHGILLCILFSWALIEYDGYPVPQGYQLLAVAVILAIPLVRPAVQPIAALAELPAAWQQIGWLAERVPVLFGLAVGLLLGSLLIGIERWTCGPVSPAARGRSDAAVACGLVGVTLGWQAAISVVSIAAVLRVMSLPATRRLPGRVCCLLPWLFLAATGQVFLWNHIEGLAWWPNSHAGPVTMTAAVIGIVLLTGLAGVLESDDAQR